MSHPSNGHMYGNPTWPLDTPMDPTWATGAKELSYGPIEYIKMRLGAVIERYKDFRIGEIQRGVVENAILHIVGMFDFKYKFLVIPNKKKGIKINLWLDVATWDWQCPTCGHVYTLVSGSSAPKCWHGYGKLMDALSENAGYFKKSGG